MSDGIELVRLEGVAKEYSSGSARVEALSGINLSVARGELVSVIGPSGSGKSTLLSVLGCLSRPSSGRYTYSGRLVSDLSERELASIRCERIGFVFQTFHLLRELTAIENVELPLVYKGIRSRERRRMAGDVLTESV